MTQNNWTLKVGGTTDMDEEEIKATIEDIKGGER